MGLRIADPVQTRIFGLSTVQKALDQEAAASGRDLRQAVADQSKANGDLAGLAAAVDTGALEEALAMAPVGRDFEARCGACRRTSPIHGGGSRIACRRCRGGVGRWIVSGDAGTVGGDGRGFSAPVSGAGIGGNCCCELPCGSAGRARVGAFKPIPVPEDLRHLMPWEIRP